MASNSSVYLSSATLVLVSVASVDHMIGFPVNCWALWFFVSGKRSLIESEILTLNLLIVEIVFSMCFFLNVLRCFGVPTFLNFDSLIKCYNAVAVVGRTMFQCQICVDRYVAVVHPAVFIRQVKLERQTNRNCINFKTNH